MTSREIRRKTRVLLVIAGLPAGGAERQMALLAQHLDRSQYEVGLLMFNAAEKIHYREVFSTPLWFRSLGLARGTHRFIAIRLILGIRRAMLDFSPDIVHSSLNVANHAVRISAIITGWRRAIVTSVRADFRAGYRWHERRLEGLLWRMSRHIICNSEATRLQMIADLGVPLERISTIANGIAPEFLSETDELPPGWWPTGTVALVVGRYQVEKRHLALIEALAAVERQQGLGEWRFVFLGEGPLAADIEAYIEHVGLKDRIMLARPLQAMVPIYRAARLLILASLFEGMPNAALEAQAASCPVAIAETANASGVVAPEDGWILGPDLADGLCRVLSLPLPELQAKGRAARLSVKHRYGLERMISQTDAVYAQVLETA